MVDVQVQVSKRELVAAAGFTAGQHPDTSRNHVVIFKVTDEKLAEVTDIVRRVDPGALRLHPR